MNEASTATELQTRTKYTYDLLGNILTYTNGEFITFTNAYNGASRLTSLTSSQNSPPSFPPILLQAVHYNAFGRVTGDTLGDTETEAFTFDNRLRPLSASSTYNSTTRYSYNVTYAPDGDVLTSSDSVNGNWTYSYDQFNRLVGATTNNPATTFSYVYDRYGNRWQQNPNGFLGTFNSNKNQIDTPYTYDPAGNLLSDGAGGNHYTYDAESRLISYTNTNTTPNLSSSYVYDALGQRVEKTSNSPNVCNSGASGGTVFYLRDLANHTAVFTANGVNQCHDEIYAGGRHLVTYAGDAIFDHNDWLGTLRKSIDAKYISTVNYDKNFTSFPFGDNLTPPTGGYTSLHFTGKERDSETGLDYFGARYYGSSIGRFMSADPKSGSAQLADPQNWNRYVYGRENPLRYIDPDGKDIKLATDQSAEDSNHLVHLMINEYRKASFRTRFNQLRDSPMHTTVSNTSIPQSSDIRMNPGNTSLNPAADSSTGKVDKLNSSIEIQVDTHVLDRHGLGDDEFAGGVVRHEFDHASRQEANPQSWVDADHNKDTKFFDNEEKTAQNYENSVESNSMSLEDAEKAVRGALGIDSNGKPAQPGPDRTQADENID